MQTGQMGGSVGPFREPATGQTVGGRVFGTFNYEAQGDISNVMPMIQAALVNAVTRVVQAKLDANQVALGTLVQSFPHYLQEIAQQSGAHAYGAQIVGMQAELSLDPSGAPAPAPMQPQQLPPDPIQATKDAFARRAAEKLDPSNYVVKAQVNIGGFKVKASSDKGLDTDGLVNQAKDKAKTTVIWWGIGCVIILIVGVGLLGLAWYIYSNIQKSNAGPQPVTGTATAATWDGKSEFNCGGNDHVKVEGVTATLTSGTAITAMGNCVLEVSNCNITAPNGISALSNAQVIVTGGSITSKDTAAEALGKASITFSGTKVTGKKQAVGGKITGP